jgi:hypothetical protein
MRNSHLGASLGRATLEAWGNAAIRAVAADIE